MLFLISNMNQQLLIEDNSEDKKYFTIIPNYILNHSTLWDREVYVQMKRIAGEEGTCWTSQKTLSKQCGISINRLKKSLNYLIEHKWIKIVGTKKVGTTGGSQKVNEYRICDLWKINMDFYEAKGVSRNDTPLTKGVSPDKPKGYHENSKGVSPGDDKEEPLNNNHIKEEQAILQIADNINHFIELFKNVNPSYKQIYGDKTQRACLKRLLNIMGAEKLENCIKTLPKTNAMEFAPIITTPYLLEKKLGNLIAFVKKENIKVNNNKVIKL